MGMTIHYKLAQERGFVKGTLNQAESLAKLYKEHEADKLGIDFEIKRLSNHELYINIGECETLVFDFKTLDEWKKEGEKDGYSYKWEVFKEYQEMDTVGEHYEKYPEQMYLWSADFCKTQFSDNIIEHKWVADILKSVASRCKIADVNDEGDYYHTGQLGDAKKVKGQIGVMMNDLGKTFEKMGYAVEKGKKI